MRINQAIAASGLASRRKADELIIEGRVRINGALPTPGQHVGEVDVVTVDDKPLPTPQRVTYVLHKPRGVVSSRAAQGGDRIVTDIVPPVPVVYPVGRLDKDSEGLILLTNDGDLAHRLTHPSFEHSKYYTVIGTAQRGADCARLEATLSKGVKLSDGIAKADQVTITQQGTTIEMHITIHEGRNHLVRRMCAAVGIQVDRLIRTRIGNLSLGSLKPGEWRILNEQDLALAQQ